MLLCSGSVAGVYYLQPLLVSIGASFDVNGASIGLIPMVTQIAVGLGVVVLLPLGDVVDNRRIVTFAVAGQIVAMLLMAWSPDLRTLLLASSLLGFLTIAPYLIPSAASHLTSPGSRGRVTGALTRGVILGILFARTAGGFVGALASWRAVYVLAAVAASGALFFFARNLPSTPSLTHISYRRLVASLPALIRRERALQIATLTQALMFGTFGSLWIALSVHIQGDAFRLSSAAVGAFGLLGLASAAVAPSCGALIDRVGADRVVRLSIVVTIISWGVMATFGRSLIGIGLGIVMLDIGASGANIAKQTTLFKLASSERTRFVTVYVVGQYVGAGLLALLTGVVWTHGGWTSVCFLGLGTTALALVINSVPLRAPKVVVSPIASPEQQETPS
jgi:predicted MFS family arabinose efflux permease